MFSDQWLIMHTWTARVEIGLHSGKKLRVLSGLGLNAIVKNLLMFLGVRRLAVDGSTLAIRRLR